MSHSPWVSILGGLMCLRVSPGRGRSWDAESYGKVSRAWSGFRLTEDAMSPSLLRRALFFPADLCVSAVETNADVCSFADYVEGHLPATRLVDRLVEIHHIPHGAAVDVGDHVTGAETGN